MEYFIVRRIEGYQVRSYTVQANSVGDALNQLGMAYDMYVIEVRKQEELVN